MKLEKMFENFKNEIGTYYDNKRLDFDKKYENYQINLEDIYKNSQIVSSNGDRANHGIRLSNVLHDKIIEISNKCGFGVGELYEMAIFMLVDEYEKIDMSEFSEIKPKKKIKYISAQCPRCFRAYNCATNTNCPHC